MTDTDVAAGVFHRVIHRADTDARTIELQGLVFWVARCGLMAIPTDVPSPAWPWCVACWTGQSTPNPAD
jgi:hypothetical protein